MNLRYSVKPMPYTSRNSIQVAYTNYLVTSFLKWIPVIINKNDICNNNQ